ncbi:MAG TPA: protein phosphatase 2C domain-containing protein [Pseudolysinimonas sp.]|jgi:protein phosphatase|nr:protein phosphatase 2C domain-containing protein [Pseudolysinimonas sp.]
MSHIGKDRAGHRIQIPGGGSIVLSWAARSDVGHRRSNNEDSVVVASPMFAVADGMGGHAAGDRASAAAVEHLQPRKGIKFLDIETLEASLAAAADDIDTLAEGIPLGVGTTVTGAALMLINELPVFAVFNIGDSRVYSLEGNELVRVTTDHSVVQELVDAGVLAAEDAEAHPDSNVITRALGFRDDPRPDVVMVPVRAGLRLLICSDGLTKELGDDRIRLHLAAGMPADETASALVDAALAAGGRDNVTVAVVDVTEAPGAAPEPE